MKQHIASVHEKDKETHEYQCHFRQKCDFTSNRKDQLDEHISAVHEKHKNHKCVSCGRAFAQSGTRNRHVKMMHDK